MYRIFQSKNNKIIYAFILILLVGITGVIGFHFIEDFSLIDSLYMTVITVSTVGFQEVHDLSAGGRLFTIFLIITSLGAFAFSLSTLTSMLIGGELFNIISGKRRKSGLRKMENHVIICGYGRNGRQAVKELIVHNESFVVVDSNHELIYNNSDKNVKFVEGDSTEDEVLIEAGIKKAKALISSLPVDADNLFVVLTARSLNPDLIIISRASNESSEKKLRIAGVNNVVMPEKLGGAHMATLVARPDVVDFLNHLSIHGEAPTNLEEIVCSGTHEWHLNKTIYEIGIRKKTGANIIGFRTPDGEYIINPEPDTKVIQNSKLFVLGTPEQIIAMKKMLRSD